jgi:hypothetical protein
MIHPDMGRSALIRSDEKGAISVIGALSAAALVGFIGLGVDFGYVYYCKDRLQAATDAAALAGAGMINVGAGGTAVSTATTYSSSGSGALNRNPSITVTMASGYPVLKCLTSTGVSCTGPDNANAIEVSQQAVVPTFFARLFGLSTWRISATSLAGAKGGSPQPLDIEIILDTTESMNNSDPNCTELSGATREDCALLGIRTLLGTLDPCSTKLSSCGVAVNGNVVNPLDRVGLIVFPGLTSTSQIQYEYDCSNTPAPQIAAYNASPVYQIIPFSSDFRSSDTTSSLNASSDLVLAARGGSSSCNEGLEAVGGKGTFYADAINYAQSELTSDGRSTAQKIIILLSDGAANAAAANMPASEANDQCHEGITAAQNATAAGTVVYSISYGSSTATNPSLCTTDTPTISSCTTMQDIASSSTTYYSDTSGGDTACTSDANPIQDLSQIFTSIGVTVGTPRLLPLNTT